VLLFVCHGKTSSSRLQKRLPRPEHHCLTIAAAMEMRGRSNRGQGLTWDGRHDIMGKER